MTAPTCTAKGFTTYVCSCGDSYTADEVPATGHRMGSEVDVFGDGYTYRSTCSVCGAWVIRSAETEQVEVFYLYWTDSSGVRHEETYQTQEEVRARQTEIASVYRTTTSYDISCQSRITGWTYSYSDNY